MRVLVIEDERKVASFVARALRENAYAVDVAETGERGLALALENPFDLIILDLRLPGMSGLQVCQRLRREGLETPVLILTARSLVEQRVEGLDAGADDYLTKPFAVAELLARARSLIRRGFGRAGAILHCAGLELDRRRRRVRSGARDVPLTAKEFALLEFLMLRAPEPVTHAEIIEHVWDCQFDSETNLVEVYINRLRRKLEQDHPARLILTLRGVGYCLAGAAPAKSQTLRP